MGAGTVLDRLATLAFPVRCPGCGRAGAPVCARCLAVAPPAPPAPPPPGVTAWSAAFAYEGVVREWIARAKYQGAHAVLGPLAVAAAGAFVRTAAGAAPPPTVVTWVPTSPGRRRARGIDHARVLARRVGRDLGLPVAALLERPPGAADDPQTDRPVALRRVGPAVRVRRRVAGRSPADLGPVLVVDDVATTGGSLRASAAALHAIGVPVVLACTVARTAPGRAAGGRRP